MLLRHASPLCLVVTVLDAEPLSRRLDLVVVRRAVDPTLGVYAPGLLLECFPGVFYRSLVCGPVRVIIRTSLTATRLLRARLRAIKRA